MGDLANGPVLVLGFMMGVGLMVLAFMQVLPAVIEIRGAESTNYVGGAFVVMLASLVMFGWTRDTDLFFIRMLVFAGIVAAYGLIWTGEQRFRLRRSGRTMWLVIGAALAVYAVLEMRGLTQSMRAVPYAVCSVLFWSVIVYKMFRSAELRMALPTVAFLAGAALLTANSIYRVLLAFELLAPVLTLSAQGGELAARFLGTMVGNILIGISYMLRYFERVVDQSNHAATHDELTGLLNRRAVVQSGERQIELARRNLQPLAVAFVDIDFFKKINDQYGHDKGDLALKEVAQVLLQSCRSIDLLGRYGGEEFCLIFPGDDHAGAQIVGERLLTAVRDHQITGLPPITISIGLAVLDLNDYTQTWHSLISQADAELYRAKHSGRNRACIAPEKSRLTESLVAAEQRVAAAASAPMPPVLNHG